MGHDPLAVRIELENNSSMMMVLLPGITMNPNSSVAPHWCGNLLRRRRRGGGCSVPKAVRSSASSAAGCLETRLESTIQRNFNLKLKTPAVYVDH
jgi:hypothetical protein